MDVPFIEKFVYMNENDMRLCHLESFSPVILKTAEENRVFLAVGCDTVRCCHVLLHILSKMLLFVVARTIFIYIYVKGLIDAPGGVL